MKKREIPVMNVGISLIILIFMNICLAAFAVLSLENAVSDYSLSKKTAKHTTQYYEAVNNVQEQLAKCVVKSCHDSIMLPGVLRKGNCFYKWIVSCQCF